MEVSKLFVSGLLCGALAFSPAKVDGLVKEAVITTVAVGGTYGLAKLGAELSGDRDARDAVQRVENSGMNVLNAACRFFRNLGASAAIVPGAIYNVIRKAVNGENANENFGDAMVSSGANLNINNIN